MARRSSSSSRSRNKVSRSLLAVMGAVVVVGGVTYYVKHRSSTTTVAQNTKPAAVAKAPAKDPLAGAVITQTPMALLATDPPAAARAVTVTAPPAAAAAPTTRPAATVVSATTQPVILPANASAALSEGKAKLDAGDLVAGRAMLNDALLSGALSPADDAAAKQLMAVANRSIVFSPKRFSGDAFQSTHTVLPGEMLQKIASAQGVSWEFLGHINGLTDPRRMRAGATLKTINGPFHAVVTKSTFTMDVYLGSPGSPGSMYVTTFPVGLGANDSTPTGTWIAGGKLKNPAYFSPRGEGIVAADDPKNPLGEFWISLQGLDGQAIGKSSYGIHGTIEPDSIGKQSSMGCIRLKNEDIAQVYELLVEGKSTIVVRE